MQAHFGHITYDIKYVNEPIDDPEHEEHEGTPVGKTWHLERRIEVLRDDTTTEEYAANTLLHELLHAACNAVGFHPHNEEEVCSALAAGLSLLLRDARNERILAELIPALQADRWILGVDHPDTMTAAEMADRLGKQMEGQRIWTVPEKLKFSRFEETDVSPYVEQIRRWTKEGFSDPVERDKAVDERVRSDFAGLAAAAAEGAETVILSPHLEDNPERIYCRPCGHRYMEDGQQKTCEKDRNHGTIHGPREGAETVAPPIENGPLCGRRFTPDASCELVRGHSGVHQTLPAFE